MQALAASVAVVLAGLAVLWQATDGGQALTAERARRLTALRDMPAVPEVVLETMTGTPLPLGGPTKRATLVEFIYTTCPTICQAAGAEMARLADDVRAAGLDESVRLVSISFDPGRDDPDALNAYGEGHGADGALWTVARPDPDDLPALLATFGVVVIPDRWGGFTHNTALHVVDAGGRLRAIVDYDDPAAALTALHGVVQ
ncbi:MAG: SCO family protein [Alphaproteobacteria bacterium HGW-Alphaproteobacteria-3]|nr:MAG: SCO family protein [Alphaproteobacteria bacterium HGW-Alphaproteobacteria-3]